MAKKFSVADLHRLAPATNSDSSLHFAESGHPTCRDTIVDTSIRRVDEDEK